MSSEKLPGRINVKTLTDQALQQLFDATRGELAVRETARRKEASQEIVRIAEANRINLASLVPAGSGTGDRLYRDPLNQFNTWKARGRKPNWLKEYLDAGRQLEDFLVPNKVGKRRKK